LFRLTLIDTAAVSVTSLITVSKLDAAHRQLRTAIRLWFMDGDPIAIHTLACAAHDIIHTLFKRKGLKGLIFDSEIIKEEERKDGNVPPFC
jgi:hypothetical protein